MSADIAAVKADTAAIKVVTDKEATMLVLDGAVYQYTANALELAPAGGGGGGGGDALEATSQSILTAVESLSASGKEGEAY